MPVSGSKKEGILVMNGFEYSCPTNIIFGRGRTSEAGGLCKGCRKVMVVYGGGSVVKNGILAKVISSLEEANVQFVMFFGVTSNPQLEIVSKGLRVLKENGCDFLLAVGGGSVIDVCKAMALAASCRDADELWRRAFLNYEVITATIGIGVVLTIAASGSETGESCVISNGKAKLIASSVSVIPRFSILDPENTLSLPSFQTACGAADILSHLQERYFVNVSGNDLSDRFLEAAMRLVIQTAVMLLETPQDIELREQLMWAGTIAHNGLLDRGRNGGDWACHMIEHEISARLPVVHGEGLAMITSWWLKFVSSKGECQERLLQFASRVWGAEFPNDSDLNIRYAIRLQENWYKMLKLRFSLKELEGMSLDMIHEIASSFSWQPGQFAVLSGNDITTILLNSFLSSDSGC